MFGIFLDGPERTIVFRIDRRRAIVPPAISSRCKRLVIRPQTFFNEINRLHRARRISCFSGCVVSSDIHLGRGRAEADHDVVVFIDSDRRVEEGHDAVADPSLLNRRPRLRERGFGRIDLIPGYVHPQTVSASDVIVRPQSAVSEDHIVRREIDDFQTRDASLLRSGGSKRILIDRNEAEVLIDGVWQEPDAT